MWIISRVLLDGSSTPLAFAFTREEANEKIAKLEEADGKGSLIFYSIEKVTTNKSVDFPIANFSNQ